MNVTYSDNEGKHHKDEPEPNFQLGKCRVVSLPLKWKVGKQFEKLDLKGSTQSVGNTANSTVTAVYSAKRKLKCRGPPVKYITV